MRLTAAAGAAVQEAAAALAGLVAAVMVALGAASTAHCPLLCTQQLLSIQQLSPSL
jgi:hypothetical protein